METEWADTVGKRWTSERLILASEKKMKIATTTVSREGFGDSAAFESRFAAYLEALEKAKANGHQLLCLPGGYFCVGSEAEVEAAKSRIVQEAKRTGIAVAVGIDYPPTNPDTDYLVQTRALTSFAVTWSPEQDEPSWRQRSTNSKNQKFPSGEICAQPQTLLVAGKEIEILSCGELFNERIRNSVIARHPDAVVDLSHNGKGFRAERSLKLLAENDMYSFCSTHATKKGAKKRGFAPGAHKLSTRETDCVTTGVPRIEIKGWEI